jgi:sacsin
MCRGPLDLAPWLHVIPAELAPFRDLLLRLGAHESFGAGQYAGVLAAMAESAQGRPLDATTLAQAISIVQACSCPLRFRVEPETWGMRHAPVTFQADRMKWP